MTPWEPPELEGYSIGLPSGFAARRRPRSSRISGSHKSRQNRSLSARPVPIVLSHRDEAIDVSHARIRAAIRKLAPGPNPGFSGFPEAINPGRIDLCRRDRYQSSCLIETKRLTYHTPGSERLLES
ncbi:hypothetical protein DdX_08458 [Ditylenchus destructor]|uniref:Uncharacterized protein n=1 Tax=Ditylenchus destructor TaxID=166010 RepID=A0AAD4R0S5_9BILA|nr:hypothetical protein DdX_08458 [Ditylenchus destructor]